MMASSAPCRSPPGSSTRAMGESPFFARRFPDHYRHANAIFYFLTILVREERRNEPWAQALIEAFGVHCGTYKGVCVFDCCQYNDEVIGVPSIISSLARTFLDLDEQVIDIQRYYAYEIKEVRTADLRKVQDRTVIDLTMPLDVPEVVPDVRGQTGRHRDDLSATPAPSPRSVFRLCQSARRLWRRPHGLKSIDMRLESPDPDPIVLPGNPLFRGLPPDKRSDGATAVVDFSRGGSGADRARCRRGPGHRGDPCPATRLDRDHPGHSQRS